MKKKISPHNSGPLFFLRFYDQTDEKIEECLKKIQAYKGVPKFVITKGPLDASVNFAFQYEKAIQVHIHFETWEDVYSVKDNPKVQQIYMKYCSGKEKKDVGFVKVKPGEYNFTA